MYKRNTFLVIISLLMVLSTALLNAATIKGKVIDGDTHDPISGAMVIIVEKNTMVVSDNSGNYSFENLNEGIYTILAKEMGFENSVPQKIELHTTDISFNIYLKPSSKQLNEILIQEVQKKETDISARNSEKNADNVINVVSAKTIELSPDITVANVLQRMSGVTIERNSTGDGQYAILRGMDKRFNYTMVNGIKIPSPDNKNRFVPLDIFPSELLERLEVTKSITANMEGDGIGGAVNMLMKDAPSKIIFSANIATGYNSLFFNNEYHYFDISAINKQSPNEKYGIAYPVKIGDFTTKNLHLNSAKATPNIQGGFSFGNRFFNNNLGVIIASSYQKLTRGNTSNNYSTSTEPDSLQSITHRFFSNQQTRLGLHAKLDFKLNENHKLMWYNALMDFQNSQVRDAISYSSQTTRFRWNHQSIYNSSLKGIHNFYQSKLNLDWAVSYGKALNETPDNIQINALTINGITSIDQNDGASRRWEHNFDNDINANLNLTYRFEFNNNLLVDLSTGGLHRDKKRGSFFNEYHFKPFDNTKVNSREIVKGVDYLNFDEIKYSVNSYGNLSDPLNYDANEKIDALYIMEKLWLKKLQIIAGVRAEQTNQGYYLKFTTEGARNDGNQQYIDILPSINVKYLLFENTNLRFSYSKAINRPSFFEIVPYNIINEDDKERGNPDLKHTKSDNFDIRYEFFPKPLEQIMIGLFYKKIYDPIEFGMMNGFGQDVFYMPMNFGNANNAGVEVDIIKYFSWFGVKANYTYTNSDITTSKMKIIPNPDPNAETKILTEYVNQTRPLFGQAEHVANFSLLFKDKQNDWDAQLAFAYTGSKLCIVSRYLNEDSWQAGYASMDASIEKRFKKGLTLFAKASNLLNSPMIQYVMKNDRNENYSQVERYNGGIVERKEYYGINISMGLKFKF